MLQYKSKKKRGLMNTELENNKLFTELDLEKLQLTYILGIFLGVISTVIFWLLTSEKLSENAKTEMKTYLNFEICIFVISFLLNIIPILGQLACVVLFVANLIISLNANKAVCSNTRPQYPFLFEVIK